MTLMALSPDGNIFVTFDKEYIESNKFQQENRIEQICEVLGDFFNAFISYNRAEVNKYTNIFNDACYMYESKIFYFDGELFFTNHIHIDLFSIFYFLFFYFLFFYLVGIIRS
jgi:hypothetical protein